jgi:hypothetical protein
MVEAVLITHCVIVPPREEHARSQISYRLTVLNTLANSDSIGVNVRRCTAERETDGEVVGRGEDDGAARCGPRASNNVCTTPD